MDTILGEKSIGILLFSDVEEQDFVGPYEVFANASNEDDQQLCQVVTVAQTREVRCRRNLRVLSDYLLAEAPRLDLLVVPGGRSARSQDNISDIVAFIQQYHKQGTIIASVCTGAYLIAQAGLLRERRATTHRGFQQHFQEAFPDILVLPDKVVDEGDIMTSGGVISGIDLGLHCLEKWFGSATRQRAVGRLDGPWK